MTVITELAGGFGNSVTLENGIVRKQFKENAFTKTPRFIRKKREELSLIHFSHLGIVPRLFESGDETLWIEYVEGESYLERLKKGEYVFAGAGELLRLIHTPVRRNEAYLRESFEKKIQFSKERAASLLNYLGLKVRFNVNWDEIYKRGTTRIHGDYWLANIIGGDRGAKVIDWEFGRIGTPYQDFAAMDLWTFREYGGEADFWRGYGERPDQDVINEYVKYECLDYLGDTTIEDYLAEQEDGFYHQKVAIIKSL